MYEQKSTKFYFIPKERLSNLLNANATLNEDGSITVQLTSLSTIILFDYLINTNIVATPTMSAFVGKIGTCADLIGFSAYYDDFAVQGLRDAKKAIDKVAKEYEF